MNGLLGKALAAPIVNVLDTPAYEESGYQKPFDCEGTTGVPVHLIQNGRLEGLLHHCESAQQLGQQPTGNAGRTAGLVKGVSRIITPRSLVMQPGNISVDELLKQLENGYYIFDAWDEFHAVNVASGDFHFPCSAVRIEHGQRVGVIEGLTFSGNIREFLPEITALGRDLCFMPLLMHETYQVAAPAVLVSEAHLS